MDRLLTNRKGWGAFILLISLFSVADSYALRGGGGFGGARGGFNNDIGNFQNRGYNNLGNDYHNVGNDYHYYNHDNNDDGVVVGVPYGGYYGSSDDDCQAAQECLPNGTCIQTQNCD